MTRRPLPAGVAATLEFGPILGYLTAYLIFRNTTFTVGGTEYSGFVAVTATFIPVFLAAFGALWALTGKVARIQVAAAVMIAVFGGLTRKTFTQRLVYLVLLMSLSLIVPVVMGAATQCGMEM